MKLKLYLAGGLFNAGERLHNLYLEKHLKTLGREVILPQREALNFFIKEEERFDIPGIVGDCLTKCCDPKILCICNADGPDADSGTAVEYGAAIATTGIAVVYRTDFRTVPEKELGVNAMLRAEGTTFIYDPCFFTELDQVDTYYQELAQKIHEACLEIERHLTT